MTETTDDLFLGGKLRILQPSNGYRAGIDPVLLAAAVEARSGQSVLELGTGVGIALACLAVRVPSLTLEGIEIQSDLALLAQKNFERNGIDGRVVHGDLQDLPRDVRDRTFDHVMANPPYFERERGSQSENASREQARGEETPLAAWIDVATRRLVPKGFLTIIQNARRLKSLLGAFDERLGSIVVRPVAPRTGKDAELIIVTARKGGRGDLRVAAPFVLHQGASHDGDRDSYTENARAILRDGAPFRA